MHTVTKRVPYFGDLLDYFEVQYALQRGHITEKTVFRQFDYPIDHFEDLIRTDAAWPTIAPRPTGILFINLAVKTERGFAYLETPIPPDDNPLVKSGDVLLVPRLLEQLQTLPKLIIVNETQQRVFVTKHHVTPQALHAMGLAA